MVHEGSRNLDRIRRTARLRAIAPLDPSTANHDLVEWTWWPMCAVL